MDNKLILPFRWLARRFLSNIPYPYKEADKIKNLTQNSSIVYVHKSKSIIFHLALNESLKTAKLPLPDQIRGIRNSFLNSYFRFLKKPSETNRISYFRESVLAKKPVELFLEKTKNIFNQSPKNNNYTDYIQILINLQHQSQHPIILIPQFFIPRVNPQKSEGSPADLVFGTTNEPGFIRALLRISLSSKSARWEVAEALNLQTYLEENQGLSHLELSQKIKKLLTNRISRLEHQYCGPPIKSQKKMAESTLSEPGLTHFTENLSSSSGISTDKIDKKSRAYFREIAACFDIDMIRLLDRLLSFVFNKIFDGLKWDSKDFDNIREAAKKGSLVILPSHRSHMDYLVMSYILYKEGIMPPHIAAGVNLSFFPLGYFFRKGGAYFIRRSFKGDPLYPEVVKAYISRLFKEEYTQEFFIEGTRSRSGKTLWPKFGLLSIMLETLLEKQENTENKNISREAIFFPANISYEKLIESESYKQEQEGLEKAKEGNLDVIKSAKILKKRFGKVYVTFDEPIYLSEHLKNKDTDTNINSLSQSLAYQISYGISRSCVITPTSLIVCALFGSHRRTLSSTALKAAIKRIAKHIEINSGPSAKFFDNTLDFNEPEYVRILDLLIQDNLISREALGEEIFYRIDEQSALSLDFYKNTIIHHFVPEAIVATAFMALKGSQYASVNHDELFQYAKILSEIFRYEFIYPPGVSFENTFEKTINNAINSEILISSKDDQNKIKYTLKQGRQAIMRIKFANRMLANFVDAYMVIFKKLNKLNKNKNNKNLNQNFTKKEFVSHLIQLIRSSYLSGRVEHPESANKATVETIIQYLSNKNIITISDTRGRHIKINKNFDLKTEKEILNKAHFNRVMY